MKLRSQDYRCQECGWTDVLVVEIPDGEEPQLLNGPVVIPCFSCYSEAERVMGSPRVLKASVPDGTDRGELYRATKEMARLKSASFDLPPDKRGDLDAEAGKIQTHLNGRQLKDKFDDR